jgi:tRNA(Ile)-lysidine synthase
MVEQFLSYCKTNNLIADGQKTLIAISGGADSVVLSHLFYISKLPFALAHCNFSLRGEHSDADEAFVRELAQQYGCELFVEHFDTVVFAKENKLSIEMAARQLRYDWFETLCTEHGFNWLATAHHQEDNAETILLNLIRGTGIRGLIGIKNKAKNIIRPLLFADKAMILHYVKENNLSYRTDESNNELIYKRNKLRNVVFPILKEMNPSVVQTMNENANRISQSFAFYKKNINTLLAQIISIKADSIQTINILELLETGFSDLLLFEWLHPFGFTEDVIENIVVATSAQSGKRFIAGNYELIKDREQLILSKIEAKLSTQTIFADTKEITIPIKLKIERYPANGIILQNFTESIAVIDLEKISFPLTVRSWKDGDSFRPLGMNKHKKLSDFFIDKKLSLLDKKKALVLTDSKSEILWVLGYRISDKVKVTDQTSEVLKLEMFVH